jgi:DNA invertase Pin-like site-specific DNA recombinase
MAERKRCAIYTRKSTEEGLEQDFNSLDAQREACAAYILSQAGEGWEAIAEHYDDGGWSGGNIDRPALSQLLGDVEAGKVDVIVVYKVDRLTRSLADFAKIVEKLDARGASFVSVTQAFNTTSSMGRLTLNVLLSFAQFEREVTSERIRDKVAASKKKGMWMGGAVPHGYRVEQRKLLIEPAEAEAVRHIFERYLELESIPMLVDELARDGYRTRRRVLTDGRVIGNVCFGRGALALMLKNPIYIGKIRHKDLVHDGEHEAIIDRATFDAVQETLKRNNHEKVVGKRTGRPSLLTGMLTDPDGKPMSASRGKKGAKTYCYYVTRIGPGEDRDKVWRFPTGEIDPIVVEAIARRLEQPTSADIADPAEWTSRSEANLGMAEMLRDGSTIEQREVLLKLQTGVQLKSDLVDVTFTCPADPAPTAISVAATLVRRGHEMKIAVAPDDRSPATSPDPILVKLMGQAFAARDYLVEGRERKIVSDYSRRHLNRLARLAWLSPDIVSEILEGRQPPHLTGRYLLRCGDVPLDWTAQREFLGFA